MIEYTCKSVIGDSFGIQLHKGKLMPNKMSLQLNVKKSKSPMKTIAMTEENFSLQETLYCSMSTEDLRLTTTSLIRPCYYDHFFVP